MNNILKTRSLEFWRLFEIKCKKKLSILLILASLGLGSYRPLAAQELNIISIEIIPSTNIDYPDKRSVQLTGTGWSENVTLLLALGTEEGENNIEQTFYTMYQLNGQYIYACLPGEEPIEVIEGKLRLMFDDYRHPISGKATWLMVQVYEFGVLKDRKTFRIR